jgi:hypothetical protein
MLELKYAPDNKWESASINNSYVAADIVAVNSPLPIKSRSTLASAGGRLPKVGMKKVLEESDINNLNVMIAQGTSEADIANKLANDSVACQVGIDELNEYNFLFALSNGYVAIPDEVSQNLLRLKFNYLDKNTYGVATVGAFTVSDFKHVIAQADADGATITKICIAKSAYDALRQTTEAKELVANYRGTVYTDPAHLSTPSSAIFNEAFADDNGGVQFLVVDRSVKIERNGKSRAVKPWNPDRAVFITNDVVGSLVYGRLAEESNPVKNVDYSKVNDYILISKYSKNDPLQEYTSGQAFVAPIIEDIDLIYVCDRTIAQAVDETAEAEDTSDEYITVFGNKYKKPELIAALKSIGVSVKSNASDATIIEKVNALSAADQAALKEAAKTALA